MKSQKINSQINVITQRIIDRSQPTRERYLQQIEHMQTLGRPRNTLGCGNLAHAMAASTPSEKKHLQDNQSLNIGIVSAYNDMLSAHQPYQNYPDLIKRVALNHGATAQVAGGVPAMCDGVTQGQPGMELSLFSREVIALSTAVALSHHMYDGVICLGICDKIVPGLLIGALRFGHLPTLFLPSGPMPTGQSNEEKAKVRQDYAMGKANAHDLLLSECRSYHSAGTCTFYGTANTNQMLMEIMGLHLPGASFITPDTSLREAVTVKGIEQLLNQMQHN
ncbi:MAG: dihydroxy-acid dehydratase, partial [Gammaproteobacteria bacterium]|nr:dihydroxy-acid dehydratase [Gammaproteobacteria bacterium]